MNDRIWAWKFNPTWEGGYWRENKNAVQPERDGAEYVRAELFDAQAALIAELRMQIAHVKAVVGDAVVLGGRARALLERMDRVFPDPVPHDRRTEHELG